MISRTILLIGLIMALTGCAVNLDTLRSDIEYNQIVKPLTKKCELKFPGMFQDVNINALVVHKSLNRYLNNIPENKTRIDFSLQGKEENFIIEKAIFTIKTDNGIDYNISGVGTENILVNGTKPEKQFDYIVTGRNGGGEGVNLLNSFSLILPFELSNAIGTMRVSLDMKGSENTCRMKWVFAK